MTMRRLMLILALLLSTSAAAGGRNAQALRDEALPYIEARGANGNRSHGSGAVIDAEGRLLTALHVVQDAVSITARWAGRGKAALTVVGIVPEADLAILRLPPRAVPYAFYPLVSPQWRGHVREHVEVAGHPLSFDRQLIGADLTQDGFVHSNTIMTADGKPLLRVDGVDLLLLNMMAPNGLSGAPVLTQAGEVAAILSGSYTQFGGYAFASPVMHLSDPTYRRFERPPQNIRPWPNFVFADLGHLRALTQSAVVKDACSTAIDSFQDAAKASRVASTLAAANLSLFQPTLDRLKLSVQNEAAHNRQLETVWSNFETPLKEATTNQQQRDRAWVAMNVECDPLLRMKAAFDAIRDVPVNGRNLVAVWKQTDQITAMSARLRQMNTAHQQMAAIVERVVAAQAKIDDKSPPAMRDQEILGLFDETRALLAFASNDADRFSREFVDIMLYARDFADRQAAYPWDRRLTDPPFTALGLSVRPAPGWVHMSENLLRATSPPEQVAQNGEALRCFVILRYITNLQHLNGQAAAVVWQAPLPANFVPSETYLRAYVESAVRTDAAHRNHSPADIISSARPDSTGWLAEATEKTTRPDAPRQQWLLRYAPPNLIIMSCSLFAATTPIDICRKQFGQIAIAN